MELLKFEPSVDTKVREDIVTSLERYLERAKQDEFIGLTIIATCQDKSVCHCTCETDNYISHIGSLTIALFRNLIDGPTEPGDS